MGPERILVVEPKRAMANAMAEVFERRGYHVVVASSGAEANRHPRSFDCGVFCLDLPDTNGITLAGWLLAENRVGCAVFFDRATDTDVRLRASNLGSFVHRSEGLHELVKVVADALEDIQQAEAVGAEGESAGALRQHFKSGPRRKR